MTWANTVSDYLQKWIQYPEPGVGSNHAADVIEHNYKKTYANMMYNIRDLHEAAEAYRYNMRDLVEKLRNKNE